MLISVENTLSEAEIPAISETAEEKGLSIGQLKHRCLQYAKQAFQGKIFVNKDTGKPIRVSRDGLMDWWKKSRKREHIIAVSLLDKFLENAVFKGDSPDYKGRPAIEGVSRFETQCKVNEKTYQVNVVTRKAFNSLDKFRFFTLKDIEVIQNEKAVSSG
jgi:hypothetical protein